MACTYTYKGKQYSEQEIKNLVLDNYVDKSKIKPFTLNDLAEIMAYGNNKIILPGYKVEYSTPLGNKYDTLEEVNQEIKMLSSLGAGEKIDNITPEWLNKKLRRLEEVENKYKEEGIMKNSPLYNELEKEIAPIRFIRDFIERNKEYEQSKEIIEQWKKENNIQYDPEEVYSRGQEFYHIKDAYFDSAKDTELWVQGLLGVLDDYERAGTRMELSFATAPQGEVGKGLRGMPEARKNGTLVYITAYPQSKDIIMASKIDNNTSSFGHLNGLEKAFTNRDNTITGIALTKSVPLRNINTIEPNLASTIDDVAHHNESVIALTKNNFRIHYGENVAYEVKQIIDKFNKILDDKYGKITKPKINTEKGNQSYKDSHKESEDVNTIIFTKTKHGYNVKWIEYFGDKEFEKVYNEKNMTFEEAIEFQPNLLFEEKGKQPTQTRDNTTSIESVKDKIDKENYSKYGGQEAEEGMEFIYPEKHNKKEYTSQALINLKIAALKEVARRYPRSLITSKVVPIDSNIENDNKIYYSKVGSDENTKQSFNNSTNTKQDELANKIETINGVNIVKVDGKDEKGEETNWYEINGKKVLNRVTDLAKKFYEIVFRDKKITETEFSKTLNEEKRKFGVMGHKMFEEAKASLTDDQGYLLSTEKDDGAFTASLSENQREVYKVIKDYLRDKMNDVAQKNPGVRFFSEKIVYSPNTRPGGEAGTIDFLYITKEGKVGILDWKFININEQHSQDVPWYKRKAWKIQLDEYRKILEKSYGVNSNNIIEASAIPILMKVETPNSIVDGKRIINIGNIQIGNVNTKLETRGYLIPVSLDYISTGYKNIDKLIERLNGLYDKISNREVKTDEEATQKIEQLTELFRGIRDLQMKLSFKSILTFAETNKKDIESFITNLKELIGNENESLDEAKKSEISKAIDEAKEELKTFEDIDLYIDELLNEKEELSDEDKEIVEMVKTVTYDVRKNEKKLEEVEKEFLQKIIAEPHGIDRLFNVERVVTGLRRWFGDTSGIPIKTLSIIYKLRNKAKNNTDFEVTEENKKLESIKEEYVKWATSKGLSIKNMFDGIIKKKDKNELIDEFNPDFYKRLREAIENKDREWIYKNVDIDALKEYLDKKLEAELQRIENRNYSGTEEEIAQYKDSLIEKAYKMYDLENMNSYAEFIYDNVKKFPDRNKWESNEYKFLKQNPAAFKFYKYIVDRNNYYEEIGYISAKEARVFLPYVRKSLTEKLIFGGDVKLGEQFLNSIAIDETTFGYGSIDPITKEPINTLPKYFVSAIENQSDISTDLFKTIALYNEMAIRYKYLSDIEGQVLHLLRTEKTKKVMQTTLFGNVKRDPYTGEVREISDDANFKLVQAHVNAIMYDRKVTEDKDIKLGTIGKAFSKINKMFGYDIFPTDLEGKSISLNRTIDANNRFFQQKILGLNVLSSISNLLGGSFQSIIAAGKYFSKTQFIAAEFRLTASKLNREDGKYIMGMIKYFMPLTESENRRLIKELSLSKLSQENIQDFLMSLMRNSDNFVQTSIFLAMLDNLIVKDGTIQNAREYLRKTDRDYNRRYDENVSEEERKQIEKQFEEKLKNLIEQNHIKKFVRIEGDSIKIDGVDRNSDSIKNIRNIVQNLSKDALGNATEDQTRLINLSIYGKSFMIFKNWIPRLVDVRFGELHYNNAFDAYEWGRFRTFIRFLAQDVKESGLILLKSLALMDGTASNKSIDAITKLYYKKMEEYEAATGEKLNMTREEFIDMVRQNIRSQMRDFLFYIGLMSAWLLASTSGGSGDDKDKRAKNRHKFLVRALDKISDEVGFFYNPLSFQNIVNGSPFPALGNISDGLRLMEHTLYQTMGVVLGDEKLQKKAHPLKYLGKTFPLSNQVISYLPLAFPDLSKDLGIQISTQSRIK